jgi:hypothetical protein
MNGGNQVDNHDRKSPKHNPHQFNQLEQESFRQNPYFAEKILPFEGMFPPMSDDHDIRKITREKVEDMLYATHLLP